MHKKLNPNNSIHKRFIASQVFQQMHIIYDLHSSLQRNLQVTMPIWFERASGLVFATDIYRSILRHASFATRFTRNGYNTHIEHVSLHPHMRTHLLVVMEVSLEVCIDSLRPVYLCNSTVRTSGQNYIVSSGAILWYHDVTRHARQHAPIRGILYTYAQHYSVKINGCTYIPF